MRCHVIWSCSFDDAGTSINLLSVALNYNDFKITVFAGNSKKYMTFIEYKTIKFI